MRLSNNLALPTLPFIAARSTWAIVLAAAVTIANVLGVDLMGFFTEIGVGSTPEEVIATGQKAVGAWQMVAPLLLGIWAWIERRAPNFRLSLGSGSSSGLAAAFSLALLVGILAQGPGVAFAQGLKGDPAFALPVDFHDRNIFGIAPMQQLAVCEILGPSGVVRASSVRRPGVQGSMSCPATCRRPLVGEPRLPQASPADPA